MAQQPQAGTETRARIEAALISKAQADPAFRETLLKNPKAAIEKEFGVTLPAGAELRVVEETASTNYLVLPAASHGDLSDAQLEGVAGGLLEGVSGGLFADLFEAASKVENNRLMKEQVRLAQKALEAYKISG